MPKAFVVLAPGHTPCEETARDIFLFLRGRLSPYKRVRRLEFAELPKTVSGKIRRAELRERPPGKEYSEEVILKPGTQDKASQE